jgi:uncharacterized phage protein (TIGR01671 family)
MREILFRGKQVNDGMWIQGYLFQCWGRAYILWGMTNNVPTMHEVIPETVGQRTGLKDRNGKMIFEGDIVKATYDCGPAGETECIVEVAFGSFGTNLQDWIFKEDGYLPEIIGNIHDNPELLT